MFWAKLGCVFGFILNCSGVLGGVSSICALKGSSVALSCSAQDPNIIKNWYKLERGDWKAISADVKQVTYNPFDKNHPTLSLTNLTKNDSGDYCCGNLTDQRECIPPYLKIHLTVTGLQVQVIPTTEGQTATLMCRTSCYLTKKPVVYIWYRNREVLYQDWSPWYQEMVTSAQATRYSCAIKDYEHLRTPEVSVDSVTSTCFSVTYTEGAMCLYNQTSMNEPCSITYPRDIFVQSHLGAKDHFRLTCNTSCPPTNTIWYKSRKQQDQKPQLILKTSLDSFSCAVKGVKDLLHSAEVCVHVNNCNTLNYTSRRICALEGSSVNISSIYSFPFLVEPHSKSWYKKNQNYEEKDETLTEAGRVEYHDNMKNQHTLTIKNVEKNDSAEYRFRLNDDTSKIGVTLTVTGLKVTFTPSAGVTEGQRVTLTCSTSCPLTDNKNYIWYFNNQPLMQPENQNKHLVLDPVRTEHSGNYSCTVNTHKHTRSLENTLKIQSLTTTWTLAAVVKFCGAILLLIIIIVILISIFCWIRGKPQSSQTLGYETSHMLEEVNTCHVYNEIAPQPAEQNDVYYSSVSFYENYTHSPHVTAQSHQDHVPYSVVGLKTNTP